MGWGESKVSVHHACDQRIATLEARLAEVEQELRLARSWCVELADALEGIYDPPNPPIPGLPIDPETFANHAEWQADRIARFDFARRTLEDWTNNRRAVLDKGEQG